MAKKKKILVVEDSPTTMEMKCSMLEEAGFQTVRATDGVEAISKVRKDRPDLVFMDVQLPDMDGYQICRLLKKDAALARIPVIMASAAKLEKKDEFWGLEVGADAYLKIPFEPEYLIAAVQKALGTPRPKKTKRA
jgi:CheY-like chemotaxis protein